MLNAKNENNQPKSNYQTAEVYPKGNGPSFKRKIKIKKQSINPMTHNEFRECDYSNQQVSSALKSTIDEHEVNNNYSMRINTLASHEDNSCSSQRKQDDDSVVEIN